MSIADKLQTILENEQKVFDAGKKAESDRFWDAYQDNGNRGNYASAFGGVGWTDELFKPKYNIQPTEAYMMFRNCQVTDLVKSLSDLGVTLDFSKSINTQYVFQTVATKRVGIIDVSSSTNSKVFDNMFAYATNLVTIAVLRWSENARGLFNGTFSGCTALENVTFDGVIFDNGLDLKNSTKLSKNSIISAINALSSSTSGLTVTFSKTAVNKAFETATGANNGSSSSQWATLIATKSNWTISLV